jgi:hypothetical protein
MGPIELCGGKGGSEGVINAKEKRQLKDEQGWKGQSERALALFRVWCAAAEAWPRQPSDVTEARCRAARQDY